MDNKQDGADHNGNITLIVEIYPYKTMKIIFLDFDGVMDTIYYNNYLEYMGQPIADQFGLLFDPDCQANLKRIIDATGAKIVVSSTWKDCMSHEEIVKMWEQRNLAGEVIGETPSFSKVRGDEIDSWLEDFTKPCNYVIIDDMDSYQFNEHQLPHLFTVNPYNGLTEDIAEQIIAALNQCHLH